MHSHVRVWFSFNGAYTALGRDPTFHGCIGIVIDRFHSQVDLDGIGSVFKSELIARLIYIKLPLKFNQLHIANFNT